MISRRFEDLDDILIDQSLSYDFDTKQNDKEEEQSDNDANEYTEDFDDASPIKTDRTIEHLESFIENDEENYEEDSFVDHSHIDQRDISSHHLNKLFPLAEGTDEDVSLNQSVTGSPPDSGTAEQRRKSSFGDQKTGATVNKSNTPPVETVANTSKSVPVIPAQVKATSITQSIQAANKETLPNKRHSLIETIASNAYPTAVKSSFELPSSSNRSPTARSPKSSHTRRHTSSNDSHSNYNNDPRRNSRYDDKEEDSPRNSTSVSQQTVSQVVQEVMKQQTEMYKAKIVENHFITSSIAAANALRLTGPGMANSIASLSAAPVYDPLSELPDDLQQLVRMSYDAQNRVAVLAKPNQLSDATLLSQMHQQQQEKLQKDKLSHIEAENTYLREALARRQRRDDSSAVNDLLGLEQQQRESSDEETQRSVKQQANKLKPKKKSDKTRPTSSKSVDFSEVTSKTTVKSTTAAVVGQRKITKLTKPRLSKEESAVAAAKKVFLSTDSASIAVNPPVVPSVRPTFLVTQKENPNHHTGQHRPVVPRVRSSGGMVSPLRSSMRDSRDVKTIKRESKSPPVRRATGPIPTAGEDSGSSGSPSSVTNSGRHSLTVLDPNKGRTYKVMRPSRASEDLVVTSSDKPRSTSNRSNSNTSREKDRPTPEQVRQEAEQDGEDYFKFLIAKNRVTRPDLTAACDHIYFNFLSDMITICKERAGDDGITAEEMAMHRVLSGYVASAFAANKVNGIQANMIRAGLEVSDRMRASNKQERESMEPWTEYSVKSKK